MYRGTTPTLQFNLPFSVSNIAVLYITAKQYDVIVLEKDLSDCIVHDTSVTVKLAQEETLKLQPNRRITLQIRCRTHDGTAMASQKFECDVKDILKEGVI